MQGGNGDIQHLHGHMMLQTLLAPRTDRFRLNIHFVEREREN